MNLTESQMLKIGVSIFAGLVVFIAIIVGIIIFKKKAADKAADDTIAADDEAADDTIAADDEAAAVKAAERAAAEKAAEKAAERAAAEKAAAEKAAAVKAAAEKAAADQAAEKAAADMVTARNSDEKAKTAIKNFNTADAERNNIFSNGMFDIFVVCKAARAAIVAEKETNDNNIVQQTLNIDDLLLYDSNKMYDKAKEDTRRAKEFFRSQLKDPRLQTTVSWIKYNEDRLNACINELKN